MRNGILQIPNQKSKIRREHTWGESPIHTTLLQRSRIAGSLVLPKATEGCRPLSLTKLKQQISNITRYNFKIAFKLACLRQTKFIDDLDTP